MSDATWSVGRVAKRAFGKTRRCQNFFGGRKVLGSTVVACTHECQ